MKVKIWLNRILSNTITNEIFFAMRNCTSTENYDDSRYPITPPFTLYIELTSDGKEVEIADDDNHYYDLYNNSQPDFTDFSSNGTYIIIDGEIPDRYNFEMLNLLIKNDLAEIVDYDNVLISCFMINCEYNKVNKDLTFVKFLNGVFNHSIDVKNINIDIEEYMNNENEQFNYVYIHNLKKYYYVDSIEIITSKITRLHLKEDVLYTFSTLIYSQKAFVSRWENSEQINMVDERLPLENVKTIEYLDIDFDGDLKNCTFNYNVANNKPVIAITSQSTNVQTSHGKNVIPTGTNLPQIRSTLNNLEYLTFIDFEHLYYFQKAYRSDDATSSYIESVIYFPFNVDEVFDLSTHSYSAIFVKDKFIDSSGDYAPTNSQYTPLQCYTMTLTKDGVSPYIIIADFTYEVDDTFEQHEPFANYEIYIPFVSWIPIQFKQFVNQQVIVYYAVDFKTGISTAYVYNVTNDYVIWSGACQLGIKLDMTTTNQIENIKQKQANDLNMILGGMSGMLAMGVGVATGNPLALVGGMLATGKSIASNVNANNMIFERAQASLGTSENALYSPNKVCIRKTYNKKIELVDETTYKEINGKPYNNYVDGLGNISGYVEIPEIHFNPQNEVIYKVEVDEIVSLLKNGVIL